MVHDYNAHMLGVDRMDQMMAYYSFQRKSIKWWRKVFFWVLEVMVNNAHILYKAHTSSPRKLTMKEFRREIAVQLCHDICRRDPSSYSRTDQSLERLRGQHFLQKGRKRRDCRVCSDRNPGGERKVVNTFCSMCSDQPPLCIGDCFKAYHTRTTI